WLNLTDSSNEASPGTFWRSEPTSSFVKKSYFINSAGDDESFLSSNNSTIGYNRTPTPVEFHSSDVGNTALISIGDYWLGVNTSSSPAVVQFTRKGSIFPYFDDRFLWSVERATSPTTYGAIYGIKCNTNGVNYYLNNTNYISLDLLLADSLVWGPNRTGPFWHFTESTPKFASGKLIKYDSTTFQNGANTTVHTTAASLATYGDLIIIEPGTTAIGAWNWHLDKNSTHTNHYEIRITNVNNDQKYVVPTNIPTPNHLLDNETWGALAVADTALQCNLIKGWRKGEAGVPRGNLPILDSVALSYVVEYPISIQQGIHFINQFSWSTNLRPFPPNQILKYLSLYLTTDTKYFISPITRTLQATQRDTNDYPAFSGKVVQPLSFREIGSDKFHIYGSNKELHVIKSNINFPNDHGHTTYNWNDTLPIWGASLLNSYMYLINKDYLWLYSLFGIKSNYKGYITSTYVGSYAASAPVYNPISHKVYVLFNDLSNNYVYGYGQSLNSQIPYSDTILNHVPKAPFELFVIPEDDLITKLYYQNKEGKLVCLRDDAIKIEIDGEPIDVSEREIRWLRYKTQLLNYYATTAGMSIVPIQNGYAANGPMGTDSSYVLFFINDPLLKRTQASLYIGPNAAFPNFPNLDTVPAVAYNNTTSMGKWTVQDAHGKSLWMEGYPLVFYNNTSRNFVIESLAKESDESDESKIYTYSIPVAGTSNTAGLFNLEWQKLAGKEVGKIKDGSPLHNWYQHFWMKNANPFSE
ncbi:MAG: hypothetical protein JKY48_18835, partial [Flavobacteriales bacterium]|nr:hypothetical protein [Flavobacteriales bacterium]